MRKKDRHALGTYVRQLADVMELRDWTLSIEHEPCDESAEAVVRLTYGRKRAVIAFAEDFRSFTPERQRHTVVHELVHCHLASPGEMVRTDLEATLGTQADQLFFNAYRRQLEYGVDAIAEALAKHLPLIEWP